MPRVPPKPSLHGSAKSTRSLVVGLLIGLCLGMSLSQGHLYFDKGKVLIRQVQLVQGTNTSATSSFTQQPKQQKALHILFGLSGQDADFFDEFQTSLKSILLNAPHNRPTHIHVMVDQDAHHTLYSNYNKTGVGVFDRLQLNQTQWYQDISIQTYNVQDRVNNWTRYIQSQVRHRDPPGFSVGAYFRLFAQEVLPPDIPFVLYLDPDVAVLANLEGILRHADPHYTLIMSELCSGIMWINVHKMPLFWNNVGQLEWNEQIRHDQILVNGVSKAFPDTVHNLPPEWDLKVAMHWQHKKRDQLLQFRPNGIGMVHYNGGGEAKGSAFRKSNFVTDKEVQDGWAIPALFYRELPWEWTKFMGQSVNGGSGGKIRILE